MVVGSESDSSYFARNRVTDNGEDGFDASPDAQGNFFEKNTAKNNAGIDFRGLTTLPNSNAFSNNDFETTN